LLLHAHACSSANRMCIESNVLCCKLSNLLSTHCTGETRRGGCGQFALHRLCLCAHHRHVSYMTATHCNALQRTATHYTLQRTATHYIIQSRGTRQANFRCCTSTHCNALQRTATHCNAFQMCGMTHSLAHRALMMRSAFITSNPSHGSSL